MKRKALNKEEVICDIGTVEEEFTQEVKGKKKVKLLITSEADDEDIKTVNVALPPFETRFNELPEELIFKILDFVGKRVDAFHFVLTNKQTFCLMPKITSICKVFFPQRLVQQVNDYFDYFKQKSLDVFDYRHQLRDMNDYNNSFVAELEQLDQFFDLKKTEFKLQQLLHKHRHAWKRWLELLQVSDSTREKINTLLSTVEYLDFKESRFGRKGFTFAKFKAAGDVFTIERFCDGREENQVLFTWNEDLIGEGYIDLYFHKELFKDLRTSWNLRELKHCEMLELLHIIIPLDTDEFDIDVA
ncbi:hypothetical protein ABK040_016861 [Willaertia magna]